MNSSSRIMSSTLAAKAPDSIEKKPSSSESHSQLPPELVNHVASFLELKSARSYAATSRFHKSSINTVEIDFKTALQLIVDGMPEEEDKEGRKKNGFTMLKHILEANNNLDFLSLRGTVINKAGDIIKDATLLEVAWGEEDPEVCNFILSYFAVLSGKDIALKQLDERFPEKSGEEEAKEELELGEVEKRKNEIWDPIVAAVDAKNEKALFEIHMLFRKLIKQRVITKGTHFSSHKKIREEAEEIYKNNQARWSYDQRLLFGDFIFGFLQRKLLASYGAAVCYGSQKMYLNRVLAMLQETFSEPALPRSFKLQEGGDFYCSSYSHRSSFFVVNNEGGICARRGKEKFSIDDRVAFESGGYLLILELREVRIQALEELKESLEASQSPRCERVARRPSGT